ncbi:hypothetical protein B0181_00305 [Moraxella caviae]|uniref:Alpha-ribazole phosphatase n=1 Tax=Moraxella caviae TaxID=34060 RepID=A0A1T0ACK6_9GAMM|nr:histidine phosphatase family protein [Moraxella caviae]OOR93422.1 hypothetical protein B0181_00305 [Moraxella caviae]STZ14079.1 Alpha-ribazole phosphatase [Moraxella caviae]VEW11150.1 Alpha-ribazole phosphatase [Moraxella caviae]
MQNDIDKTLRLDFLRHGETTLLTQGNVLRGRTDDALTQAGFAQMHSTFSQAWRAEQSQTQTQTQTPWQAIITSPLSRCLDFAKVQSVAHDLPLFVIDELQEIDFGDWEGCATAELYAKFPDELATYWQAPQDYTPPNAESVLAFRVRVGRALERVASVCRTHEFERVCVVSHGGVIKMLYHLAQQACLEKLLGVPVALGELHSFDYVPVSAPMSVAADLANEKAENQTENQIKNQTQTQTQTIGKLTAMRALEQKFRD